MKSWFNLQILSHKFWNLFILFLFFSKLCSSESIVTHNRYHIGPLKHIFVLVLKTFYSRQIKIYFTSQYENICLRLIRKFFYFLCLFKVSNIDTRMASVNIVLLLLTLSWRRSLSYTNQSIYLQSKSMDLFLYYKLINSTWCKRR